MSIIILINSDSELNAIFPLIQELSNLKLKYQIFMFEDFSDSAKLAINRLENNFIPYKTIGKKRSTNVDKFLNHYAPKLIIMCNDISFFNLLIVQAARRRNINTLLVEYGPDRSEQYTIRKGVIFSLKYYKVALHRFKIMLVNKQFIGLIKLAFQTLLRLPRKSLLMGNSGCNVFCVSTEHSVQDYIKQKVKARTIIATGIPSFTTVTQHLITPRDTSEKLYDALILTQPFDRIGIVTNKWKILFYEHIVELIRNADKNAKILCKVHPYETIDEYRELNVDFSNDLFDAISKSKISISISSTTLIQSAILGNKIISYIPEKLQTKQLTSNYFINEIRKMGLVVKNDESFTLLFNMLMNDSVLHDNLLSFIKRYELCFDGKATNRIINIILQLLSGTLIESKCYDCQAAVASLSGFEQRSAEEYEGG